MSLRACPEELGTSVVRPGVAKANRRSGEVARQGSEVVRRGPGSVAGRLLGSLVPAALTLVLLAEPADSQTRFMYLKGQAVSPAYEGWWPNEGGGYTLFFGYMNSNWEEEFDIPVGSRNYFAFADPGELDNVEMGAFDAGVADQGQPTHFYPRRNPFLFTVDVPEGFGETELVWTLESKGETLRAYGSIAPDYRIDPQVISTEVGGNFGSLADALRTNIPPELQVEGGSMRSVRLGEPLELVALAHDPDDYPPRRDRPVPSTPEGVYDPPSSIVAISGPGLRMSWIVYRGPAEAVSFEPTQFKTWTDTRAWANSPWSPPWIIPEPPADGRWEAEAVFSQPGDYVLRAVASDGSLFTHRNVYVTVEPPGAG